MKDIISPCVYGNVYRKHVNYRPQAGRVNLRDMA